MQVLFGVAQLSMLPVVLNPGYISDSLGDLLKVLIPGLHSQIVFFNLSGDACQGIGVKKK